MATPFADVGGQLFERVFGSILWTGLGLFSILLICGVFYYFVFYKRKFDIVVKVNSERAGDKNKIIYDRAAILVERKTGVKYFKLWKLKKPLPVPQFNVLQTSDKGDYLELSRTGEDQFYFLTPTIIDKKQVVKEDGKFYPIAVQKATKIEVDLDYWNVKRKLMNKKMFDSEGLLMKLLPYIPIIVGGMIMIFMLYILMDHLPGILSEMRLLYEAQAQVAAAEVTVYGS